MGLDEIFCRKSSRNFFRWNVNVLLDRLIRSLCCCCCCRCCCRVGVCVCVWRKKSDAGVTFLIRHGWGEFCCFFSKSPLGGTWCGRESPRWDLRPEMHSTSWKKNENKTERFEFSFGSCFHPSPPSPASHLVTACPDRPEVVVGWPPGGGGWEVSSRPGGFFFGLQRTWRENLKRLASAAGLSLSVCVLSTI